MFEMCGLILIGLSPIIWWMMDTYKRYSVSAEEFDRNLERSAPTRKDD